MAQFFTTDQIDQRIRRAKQGLTAKADGDQMRDFAVREARHLLHWAMTEEKSSPSRWFTPGQPTMLRVQMRSS